MQKNNTDDLEEKALNPSKIDIYTSICEKYFPGGIDDLDSFRSVYGRNNIKNLNLSNNRKLKFLKCVANDISTLILANNSALKYLDCRHNKIERIDTKSAKFLQTLRCKNNKINFLDLSSNHELKFLECSGNNIDRLDLKNNPKLEKLICDEGVEILNQTNNLEIEFRINLK